MDRRLTRQISALNGDQFNFQPGRINGILLLFEGTAATGVTADLQDLGSVVVNRNQEQKVNARIYDIGQLDDVRFGSNLFSSAEAGAFVASVFIPFFESGIEDAAYQNSLEISGDSELNFEWIPASGIGAIFDDCRLSVYSQLAAYPERYEYLILRDDQNEGGAVSGKPYQLNKDNITSLFISDPDSIVDLVQFEQQGRSVVSPQSWNALLSGTLLFNRLETASFDTIEIQAYTTGNLETAVNYDSVLSLTTSGAGDIPILTTSVKF